MSYCMLFSFKYFQGEQRSFFKESTKRAKRAEQSRLHSPGCNATSLQKVRRGLNIIFSSSVEYLGGGACSPPPSKIGLGGRKNAKGKTFCCCCCFFALVSYFFGRNLENLPTPPPPPRQWFFFTCKRFEISKTYLTV